MIFTDGPKDLRELIPLEKVSLNDLTSTPKAGVEIYYLNTLEPPVKILGCFQKINGWHVLLEEKDGTRHEVLLQKIWIEDKTTGKNGCKPVIYYSPTGKLRTYKMVVLENKKE